MNKKKVFKNERDLNYELVGHSIYVCLQYLFDLKECKDSKAINSLSLSSFSFSFHQSVSLCLIKVQLSEGCFPCISLRCQ